MKNKFYIILFAASLMIVFIAASNVKAQTVLYSQNFDSSNTVLPTGWTADPGGWILDTTLSNVDTIPGASGLNNIAVKNVTAYSGTFNLYSGTISTLGYDSISALWDARLTKHFPDSGSTISFAYSINGGSTWTNVPYTENDSNSLWYAENDSNRIKLPANAGNQATLQFKWVAVLYGNPSGTYRIDDFNVKGDTIITNGITEYIDQDIFKVYTDQNKLLHLNAAPSFRLPAASCVTISDIAGRICLRENLTSNDNTFSLSDFKTGIYYVRVIAGDLSFVQKVIICN